MEDDFVPIYVNIAGLRITVFGGGNVALRKCRHFKNASITVVAETILPELMEYIENARECRITDDIIKESIDGAYIVIAATDDRDLNEMIRKTASAMGIPVNSAHGGGDVLIPSVIERNGYSVAVSTKGVLPAFSPYLASDLDGYMGQSFDMMFDVLLEARDRISGKWTQPLRAKFLRSVTADSTVREAVDAGERDTAAERIRQMEAAL